MFKSLENKKLALAGDARHDRMGHCAKYGVYSMFSCDDSKVIDFQLVQVKYNKSSFIISDIEL